jgi:hypothetical protein
MRRVNESFAVAFRGCTEPADEFCGQSCLWGLPFSSASSVRQPGGTLPISVNFIPSLTPSVLRSLPAVHFLPPGPSKVCELAGTLVTPASCCKMGRTPAPTLIVSGTTTLPNFTLTLTSGPSQTATAGKLAVSPEPLGSGAAPVPASVDRAALGAGAGAGGLATPAAAAEPPAAMLSRCSMSTRMAARSWARIAALRSPPKGSDAPLIPSVHATLRPPPALPAGGAAAGARAPRPGACGEGRYAMGVGLHGGRSIVKIEWQS